MDIETMTQNLREAGIITGLNHWQGGAHERTYIRVRGYDATYRGCKSHQLYWDHVAGQLVSRSGKGTATYDFLEAVAAVEDAFAAVSR